MKARDVVGHRIVKVRQERFWNPQIGETVWGINSITLDNGAVIILIAHETDQEPYVAARLVKP